MKVIVGMSGGVDSSVTAFLLKEQGYEVEGVSFILSERRIKSGSASSLCCSLESLRDAGMVADLIGIRHTMVNLRNEFTEFVIEPFIDSYSKGRTPNPCILCNGRVKFRTLLMIADERGAGFIATGHYARVEEGRLLRGVDAKKDQSYVLYVLKRDELRRLVLPLGSKRKEEVRAIARELNLPSALRPESQEICFVGGERYSSFLRDLGEGSEGPVIESGTGRVLGSHGGIYRYTVGQRKGLGIAAGRTLYVSRIDPSVNAIYVGPRETAMAKEISVRDTNWLLEAPRHDVRAMVKVRSTMRAEPATIRMTGDVEVSVVFDEPQWAPAPGQSAVFYEGDAVIGGGVIV